MVLLLLSSSTITPSSHRKQCLRPLLSAPPRLPLLLLLLIVVIAITITIIIIITSIIMLTIIRSSTSTSLRPVPMSLLTSRWWGGCCRVWYLKNPAISEQRLGREVGSGFFDRVRRLKNVGREGHTILSHITDNWDNLAEHTLFCQVSLLPRRSSLQSQSLASQSLNGVLVLACACRGRRSRTTRSAWPAAWRTSSTRPPASSR